MVLTVLSAGQLQSRFSERDRFAEFTGAIKFVDALVEGGQIVSLGQCALACYDHENRNDQELRQPIPHGRSAHLLPPEMHGNAVCVNSAWAASPSSAGVAKSAHTKSFGSPEIDSHVELG